MSEQDDEYDARRARDFADRIQAAGVRHAAVTRRPSPITPAERAEIEAMLPPDLRDGRSSVIALATEYERGTLAAVVLGLLRRAHAAEAIVAGRETEPTHEEFLAHDLAEGGWLVAYVTSRTKPDCQCMKVLADYADARGFLASIGYTGCKVIRWWALGTNGAPCAWPVPKGDEVERVKQREMSR